MTRDEEVEIAKQAILSEHWTGSPRCLYIHSEGLDYLKELEASAEKFAERVVDALRDARQPKFAEHTCSPDDHNRCVYCDKQLGMDPK